jgi:hypothetical protein
VLLSVAAALLLLLLLPFAAAQVRVDPRAIAKYRDDPVVMQAFSKLLEIENILERL